MSAPIEISADARAITLINVFTVAPEKQESLVELLARATREVMQRMPGFLSASIHRSIDGTRVTNYAQWRSQADFEAMLQHEEARAHMTDAAALAIEFEPVLYHVASVHTPG
jgi:heme-degrading monooxygenase HmoA